MESTHKQIVTRLAPSPTGFVHIGSLYMALFNYLLARKSGGKFLLRIEDTDRERYIEGSIEGLIRVLDNVGLTYDEGPILVDGKLSEKGEHGPYTQSARLDIYRKHVDQLLEAGHAYHCFCSRERLDQVRTQQQLAKMPTKYDRTCTHLSKEAVQEKLVNGDSYVIRMRVPEGESSFHDEIRGTITFQNSEVDDQVLLKSDGFPTYHLAVVVDDHSMGVTHVFRGEEWISSTPKHLILYAWFQFELPVFIHLPLILNTDRSKLSKRQGDVSVETYLKKGYLPEALLNFVGLLGFNPGGERELYSLQELVDVFELSKLNKSGSVFNIDKLNWMNAQHIKRLPHDELVALAKPFVQSEPIDDELLSKILVVEKERIERLDQIDAKIAPYLHLPEYETTLLTWKKSDAQDANTQLLAIKEVVASLSNEEMTQIELIEGVIKRYIESNQLQNGNVLWPLRAALSGSQQSANPFELVWVLGKDEAVSRITKAITRLA